MKVVQFLFLVISAIEHVVSFRVMADFLELISFARKLLGVPQDLIVDQVMTTSDKCTVHFANNQSASFRIVEVREGRRTIQRPALLVELESRTSERVTSDELPGNQSSTSGANQTATDPRKRVQPAGTSKGIEPKNSSVERVQDYVAPIDDKNTNQSPSTSDGSKSEITKADKPPARNDLRRKALLGAIVKGSP